MTLLLLILIKVVVIYGPPIRESALKPKYLGQDSKHIYLSNKSFACKAAS